MRRRKVNSRTPCSKRPLIIVGSMDSFSSISRTLGPTTSCAKRFTVQLIGISLYHLGMCCVPASRRNCSSIVNTSSDLGMYDRDVREVVENALLQSGLEFARIANLRGNFERRGKR